MALAFSLFYQTDLNIHMIVFTKIMIKISTLKKKKLMIFICALDWSIGPYIPLNTVEN